MKTYIYLTIFLFSLISYSQESLKKRYYISTDTTKIKIMESMTIKYDRMTIKQKDTLKKKFPLDSILTYTYDEIINGKKSKSTKTITVTEEFYKNQNIKKDTLSSDFKNFRIVRANVKYDNEENKLYINPWLIKYKKSEGKIKKVKNGELIVKNKTEKDTLEYKHREKVYYLNLENREIVSLWFNEGVVSSFAIPIKYRFRGKEGLDEDFTASFNVNLFLGYAIGKTYFTQRNKIGVKSNTWKVTFGGILGTSTIELDSNNTSLDLAPLTSDESFVKGLASLGFGATFSYNKINLGVFLGQDYAIGENADKWNYNKEPWLGIGLGYSLFKL